MQKSNQILREERKKKENEEKERIEELIDQDRDAYIKKGTSEILKLHSQDVLK